ncbi:MAG: hypothetical protein EZS28_018454, partial [Streblomastix strix]
MKVHILAHFEYINFTTQSFYGDCWEGIIEAYLGTSSGGLNLDISQDVQLTIEQCTFINCSTDDCGGGLYCYIHSNGSAVLSNVTFDNCSAENGGGIYTSIYSGGRFIIKDQCSFSGCKAISGNGGGIYIEYYSEFEFKINDATIRECEAVADTSEIPPTGYGGGIFFISLSSLDILPKNLNFKGMKIYNNTAERGGQSLYVVMTKLKEWCQYGIDGEHVKGNYTDGLSNKNEIQGILVNSTTFRSYSSTQINEQQVYLEDYWIIERNDYYIKTSGSDTNSCSQSEQCQTLDADNIKNSINNASSYTVYILDNTTLSSILEITQSSSPRTFRNYSIDSTIKSLIQINTGGQFSITGSAHFEYINFTMQSGVSNAYGGVINANLGTALSTLEFLRCNFTDCYSTNMGGALYLVISNTAQATFQQSYFYNCSSSYGGGMYSQVSSGAQITTLTGICYSRDGGGMYIDCSHQGDIQFFQFGCSQCSSTGKGAGLYASLRNGAQLTSTGQCIFQLCQSQGNGGGAYFDISGPLSKVNLTGINQRITGCRANEGAGIYAVINNYAVVEINNESFTNCSSTESGGGLFASILDAGTINIKNSTFTNCNCTQPGSGGAVSINQDVTSKIFISNSSFSNCKTLVNAQNSIYGWGGAIYVYTNITSANLNNTNFLMTDLVFQSCEAVKNNGNNLHIRSPNTKATGNAISSNSLLTVNGTTNLYTSLVIEQSGSGNGAAINAELKDGSLLVIQESAQFNDCLSELYGGAIYSVISGGSVELSGVTFEGCQGINGGGIYSNINTGGKLIMKDSCKFSQCKATSGNGGAIYIDIDFDSEFEFKINDATIRECEAVADISEIPPTGLSEIPPTGYGGGIFLTGTGDYDPLTERLNLKGMKIYRNKVDQNGQSMYVVMSKLAEWCNQGTAGQYVKGNYTDGISNKNELQGIPVDSINFIALPKDLIQLAQKPLEYYWANPQQDIWHIQSGQVQLISAEDQFQCGNIDDPCATIEYALKQISIRKGGSETSSISEKKIGITEGGIELSNPIEFNQLSYTSNIKIMKQMYGTSSAINVQAEIKIMKKGDDSLIEIDKQGWISTVDGLELGIFGINFITDQSKLTIPIIYIQDSNSILELNSVTFSGIELSPTTEAKAIIHINENSQFIASNCVFENIDIEEQGGNAIRIVNSGSYTITATLNACEFNNINSVGDSNGRGGSAIYMENKHGSKLVIDDSCQFYKCITDKANGGAIYVDIDFTSEFEFKINNALIQECEAKADSIQSYPTGYGGGMFLTGDGNYDPSTKRLDLKGMNIYKNSANNGGQSLFVVMNKLAKWCQYGTAGEYVKGNYTDGLSNKSELQGLNVDFDLFNQQIQSDIAQGQKTLEYLWTNSTDTIPEKDIWHVQTGQVQLIKAEDQYQCGHIDDPCATIEYALKQISVRKGESETQDVHEKKIGITENGFDLNYPFEFNQQSHASNIKIMKQLYGTSSALNVQAEIKIMKKGDDSLIEIDKQGWISTVDGLELGIFGINFITDQSKLTIPIIYIQDSNSILELNSVTFSGIELSPTTEAKAIIHINENSQFIASNCVFENIDIEEQGGNAIRIVNSGSYTITATLNACEFNNINSVGDSNGRGGSAIYMENKHGSKLVIDDSCQFYKCITDKANGGAIYVDIDFTSEFEFKINSVTVKECQIKIDTSKDLPPTGYGGGIFITGDGNYDPSTKRLDLSGMQILDNSAEKSGQSLYV